MKAFAIAVATIRESFRWPTLVASIVGLAAWVAVFDSVGGTELHVRERIVFGAIAGIGGLLAVFTSTASFSEEIRLRRLDMIMLRPVTRVSLLLGKFAGVACGVALFVAVVAVAGYAWIAKGAAAENRDLSLFRLSTPVAIEYRGENAASGGLMRLAPGGDEVLIRYEGVERLGEEGLLSMRVTAFRDRRLALRSSMTLSIGPDAENRRIEPVTIDRNYDLLIVVRDADVADDGRMEVALRTRDAACRVVADPSRWVVRAGRASYATSYTLCVIVSALGLMLVVALGVAISTGLSAATGALALGFVYAAGYLRGYFADLAYGVGRAARDRGLIDAAHSHDHAHAGGAAHEAASDPAFIDFVMRVLLRIDEGILRALGTAPPPFGRFHLVGRLADGHPIGLAEVGEALGWGAAYALPAAALAVIVLARRPKR